MTITLAVNSQPVQVPGGATLLDAVNASDAYISQLCKDPDMKSINPENGKKYGISDGQWFRVTS